MCLLDLVLTLKATTTLLFLPSNDDEELSSSFVMAIANVLLKRFRVGLKNFCRLLMSPQSHDARLFEHFLNLTKDMKRRGKLCSIASLYASVQKRIE